MLLSLCAPVVLTRGPALYAQDEPGDGACTSCPVGYTTQNAASVSSVECECTATGTGTAAREACLVSPCGVAADEGQRQVYQARGVLTSSEAHSPGFRVAESVDAFEVTLWNSYAAAWNVHFQFSHDRLVVAEAVATQGAWTPRLCSCNRTCQEGFFLSTCPLDR